MYLHYYYCWDSTCLWVKKEFNGFIVVAGVLRVWDPNQFLSFSRKVRMVPPHDSHRSSSEVSIEKLHSFIDKVAAHQMSSCVLELGTPTVSV